jgi:STE24 endopeptidase
VVLIGGLIDLPFSLYRQFVVEERFGFNKMTFGLFWPTCSRLVACVLGLPLLLACCG